MEDLPTEKAEDAARQAAQPQRRNPKSHANMERISHDQQNRRFMDEPPVETLNELYGKMYFADGSSRYEEISKHLPTGFLNEDEIRWMHGLHDITRFVARLQQTYDIPMGNTADFLQRKMQFITRVSLSRSGFAVKEVSQHRVESDELVQTDHGEQEQGMLDRIMEKIGGAGLGDSQVIGTPEYGSYTGSARRRAGETRPRQQDRGRLW